MDKLNWLDLVFIAIFLASTLLGAMRGLARVAIGLAATVLGVLFAARWYAEAGFFLQDYVSAKPVANGLGFLLVLIVFLAVGGILSVVLASLFKWAGVSWLDRLLGALFGVLRGVIISIAIVMVGMAFPRHTLPETISRSQLAPYILEASRTLAAITPNEFKDAFRRNYEEVKQRWNGILDDAAHKAPLASF